jgi:GTP:adenosylcobinamide-phosphate guanylyltransferase
VSKYTALLLAGSRPGHDPFAEHYGAELKPLIPVCGEPMVLRPLRALLASRHVAAVRVLSQEPDKIAPVLPDDPRWSVEPSSGTIAETLEGMLGDERMRWPVLVTTADHALLDTEMIDQFCREAAGADLAIAVVTRSALQKRLPQSRRTWIAFRRGKYTGANLFAFGSPRALKAVELWRSVEQDRKKGWRLLLALGWPGLLGLLRLRTLDQTLDAIGRRLGLALSAIRLDDPLAAVDVDKPQDHELVTAILEQRT